MAAMNGPHIDEIRDGDRVTGTFLVAHKTRAVAKNGKPYLVVRVRDKTGMLEGRVWENAEELDGQFDEGQVVIVTARASTYRGDLQLTIDAVEPAPVELIVLEDYLPSSVYPLDDLQQALHNEVAAVADPFVRALLQAVLDDPQIAARLRVAPAATGHHHAFLGGLLEHTLSVVRLADGLCRHYERLYPGLVDRSLLIAGAVLHDIGKTVELEVSTALSYSDEGRLIGHLVQGAEIVARAAARVPDMPSETVMRLKHLILSHHGQLEFGSPKRPHLVEAMLLHQADMIDSRTNMFAAACREAGGDRWSKYQPALEAYVFNAYERTGGDPVSAPTEFWLQTEAESALSEDSASSNLRSRNRKGSSPTKEGGPRNLDLF